MILVLREIILRSQIVTQCHGTALRQTFIRFQRSFRRSIANNIQALHIHIRIILQIVNHGTYLTQFLGIIHIFRTNIHSVHHKVQETFSLYITTLYLFHHRFYIRQIGSHYIWHQHTFKRNLIKSIFHIHQCAFTTTTFVTLHVQPGICHPRFIG